MLGAAVSVEEEEEEELPAEMDVEANDTQCAQCDNGGDLLLCDGPCMRAFHIPEEEGDEGEFNIVKPHEDR